jgi:hypothetical protein
MPSMLKPRDERMLRATAVRVEAEPTMASLASRPSASRRSDQPLRLETEPAFCAIDHHRRRGDLVEGPRRRRRRLFRQHRPTSTADLLHPYLRVMHPVSIIDIRFHATAEHAHRSHSRREASVATYAATSNGQAEVLAVDVLSWLWWIVLAVANAAFKLLWFLISGWVSTLLQIAVLVIAIYFLKYGWQRAPAELWRRTRAFAGFFWNWVRAREAPVAASHAEAVRVISHKEFDDINISTLLSLLVLFGLLAASRL